MRRRGGMKVFSQSSRFKGRWAWRKMTAKWVTVILLFGSSCLSSLEIKNDLEAINIAGSERMMVMRMLKDYILIAMKNRYGNPEDDLRQMMKRFETTQNALRDYIKDPGTVKHLEEIDKMWVKAKKMLESPPKKEDAPKYFETIENLKVKAETTVFALVEKSKQGIPQAVNMAGRLRAISQKLAALYMLKTWEVDQSPASLEMPMKKFRKSLDFLKKVSGNDEEVMRLLKDLEKTYLFFSIMEESGTFTPSLVVKKTDEMMKKADKLTRLYVSKPNQKGEK